ncbi:MAG: Dihydrolipoamide acetyltransferase component of pyruvate dehydrogenase complex [Verrucomicrobiales bacterium]|nr:Dihydrolipoamide acetyltransferase component of pyruvate dehydrogenase complex [Verrucomicrobiales bacterium]
MDVRLPKLGEGADTGTVVGLFVKEGDLLKKGQTMLELENEKAVAAIPSPAEGKITRLNIKVGDKISVGQVILAVEGGAAAPAAPAPQKAAPAKAPVTTGPLAQPATAPAPVPQPAENAPRAETAADKAGFPPAASPTLRAVARDLGINLHQIQGSAPGGRIVLADLRGYIQRLQEAASVQREPSQKPVGRPEQTDFSKWGPIAKRPMSPLRQTISRRMVENWTTIPHVTQFDEADITGLMELRKKFAAAYEGAGTKLTLTPFSLKAAVIALKKHPIFNSSIDEVAHELITKEYYHLGLAVDTEAGLMVPVIRDVDRKSLADLSKEVNSLAEKARERKLSLEEMRGGTFTISNQGGIGGAHFTPIVNKPEVAILGLGRAQLKVVVRNKQIEQRLMMPVCISYDHRVIDGGVAARFCQDLLSAFEGFKEEDVKI